MKEQLESVSGMPKLLKPLPDQTVAVITVLDLLACGMVNSPNTQEVIRGVISMLQENKHE